MIEHAKKWVDASDYDQLAQKYRDALEAIREIERHVEIFRMNTQEPKK